MRKSNKNKLRIFLNKGPKIFMICMLLALVSLTSACNYKNPMKSIQEADSNRLNDASIEETNSDSNTDDNTQGNETESSQAKNPSIINTNEQESKNETLTESAANTNKSLTLYTIGKDTKGNISNLNLNNVNYQLANNKYEVSKPENLDSSDLIKISNDTKSNANSSEAVLLIVPKQAVEELSYFIELTVPTNVKIGIMGCDINDDKYDITESDISNAFSSLLSKETDSLILQCTIGNEFSKVSNKVIDNDKKIDLSNTNDLAYISLFYDYLGNDGMALEKDIANNDGVIVVTTNQTGDVSGNTKEIIESNYSDVPVIIVSILQDKKQSNYHTPTQARILLSLVLTKTHDINEIKDYYMNY